MDHLQTKVLKVDFLTAHAGAYAWADDGSQCYIPTGMRDALNVAQGDTYFATVKENYEGRKDVAKYIAVRLHVDHPQTVLVDDEDLYEDTSDAQEPDVTPGIDERDLTVETSTRSLSVIRDQMFSILMDMPDPELADMIIDVLSFEPMGFVDVLWSLLSIAPIRHKDMNDLQLRCYQRVNKSCTALHQAGRLVQAKYTTYNHEGKPNTHIVYGTRLSQLDPTQV